MDTLLRLFDASDFPARWQCGRWTPLVGWLHIVSDVLIFLAYSAIPAGLLLVYLRKREADFPRLLLLFVAFILACGLTHLCDAMMFYHPAYRLLGVMKAATAAVSLATAVVLIANLPELISLPSVRRANRALTQAVAQADSLRAELETARREQEERSTQLTLRNRRMTAALDAARVVAVQWSADTNAVRWELGYAGLARALGLPSQEFGSWQDLLAPDEARRLVGACRAHAAGGHLTFESTIAGSPSVRLRLSALAEPHVRGEPPSMTGMFRLIPSGE
ncbi:MAG: hypothetical protein KF768_09415 [Phycisphaeraceae bacterium]|nr:hypothetical protein [Phycisphaeraceae bacterium]